MLADRSLNLRLSLAIATLLVCLLTFAEDRLQIQPVSSPAAKVGVNVTSLDAFAILQRSNNLQSWEDVMLISRAAPSEIYPDPTSNSKPNIFYRLTRIDPTSSQKPSIRVNLNPGSSHLGSLNFGPNVNFEFYGARDSDGYPNRVEQISHRIGSQVYQSLPPENLDPQPVLNASSAPLMTSGFVDVLGSATCLPTSTPPLIEYVATASGGGLPNEEVRGLVQTRHIATTPQFSRYSFEFPVRIPDEMLLPNKVQRGVSGLVAGVKSLVPDSPTDLLIEGGKQMLEEQLPQQSIKLLRTANVAANVYTFLEAAGQEYEESAYEFTLEKGRTLVSISIRAVIPTQNGHFMFTSQWQNFPSSTIPIPGAGDPPIKLTILSSCESRLQISQTGSYARSNAHYVQHGSYSTNVEDLKQWSAGSTSLFCNATSAPSPNASSFSSNRVSSANDTIIMRMTTSATSSHEGRYSATGTADSILAFKIVPTIGMIEGANLRFKISTEVKSGLNFLATLETMNNMRITGLTGSGVQYVELEPGQTYKLTGWVSQASGMVIDKSLSEIKLQLIGYPLTN